MPAVAQNVSDLKQKKIWIGLNYVKRIIPLYSVAKPWTGQGTDPEMMDILQKFIFGEVFRTGELDIKTREMITCVTLATMQTLPQLKAHAGAALNVGVTPVELREAIYSCAPFIGFPKTLNALTVINEVFKERDISCHWKNKARLRKKTVMKKGRLCKTGFIPAVSAR